MSRRTGADPLGPACGPPTIDAIIEFWSLEVSKVLKMPTRRAVRGNAAMHLEAFLNENCREQWRGFTRMEMVLSRCLVWRGRLSRRPPHFSPPAAAAVSPALDEHTRQQPAATSSTSFEPVGRSAHGEARDGEAARRRDGARPKDSNRAAWPHPLHWTKQVARSRGRKNCSLCASTVHQESWQALPELKLAAGREGLGVQS